MTFPDGIWKIQIRLSTLIFLMRIENDDEKKIFMK